MRYIDLSHTVSDKTEPYPGDSPPSLFQDRFLATDGFNSFRAEFGTHLGTHLDCPSHLTTSEKTIADYPPDRFCGNCFVIDARGKNQISWRPEFDDLVLGCRLVLVCTGHAENWGQAAYFTDHPELTLDFARELKKHNIGMVGIDSPSPDKPPFTVHKQLLADDILILENLTNLEQVAGRKIRLYAFPLKLATDASWVRAIAEVEPSSAG